MDVIYLAQCLWYLYVQHAMLNVLKKCVDHSVQFYQTFTAEGHSQLFKLKSMEFQDNRLMQSYVNKEFFLFCLPSYFIIVSACYRLYGFYKQDITPKEDWLAELQKPLTPAHRALPVSLKLKLYITRWIGSVYLLTFVLSFLNVLIEYDSPYIVCYLLMAAGQAASHYLLEREHERALSQNMMHRVLESFYSQLFWPFQAAFFFARLLQPYMTLLFIMLNLMQLVPSSLLMLYGLFKPDDSVIQYNDEEVPTFAQDLFNYVENHRWFRKEEVVPTTMEMQPVRTVAPDEATYKEFIKILDDGQRPSLHHRESFLVNKLPKRAVMVSKKVIKRFDDNKLLYFYSIITQIDQSHYVAERRFPEFIDLEKSYKKGTVQNVPQLRKMELLDNEEELSYIQRRAEVLEEWLKELLKQPNLIGEALLQFLNVGEEHQGMFLAYSGMVVEKNRTPKRKHKTIIRESIESKQSNKLLLQTTEQYIAENMADLRLTGSCSSFEYGILGSNSQEYAINITYNDKLTYRILRTIPSIKTFAKQLEQHLGRTLPASMVINPRGSNQQKIQNVDYFFRQLLENQDFFCPMLFDYINFDVRKRTEVHETADHTAHSP